MVYTTAESNLPEVVSDNLQPGKVVVQPTSINCIERKTTIVSRSCSSSGCHVAPCLPAAELFTAPQSSRATVPLAPMQPKPTATAAPAALLYESAQQNCNLSCNMWQRGYHFRFKSQQFRCTYSVAFLSLTQSTQSTAVHPTTRMQISKEALQQHL
jgi:hypothetical protein